MAFSCAAISRSAVSSLSRKGCNSLDVVLPRATAATNNNNNNNNTQNPKKSKQKAERANSISALAVKDGQPSKETKHQTSTTKIKIGEGKHAAYFDSSCSNEVCCSYIFFHTIHSRFI